MTRENTYRDKARAVFLAAIMVLSVVAMTATFAGGVVAQENQDIEVSFSDEEADVGQTVDVSFDLDPEDDPDAEVGAYDVEINYDPDVVSPVDIEGEDLDSPTWSDDGDGTISANTAQATGESVPLTAATLTFEVDDGADDGDVSEIALDDDESTFSDPVDDVTFGSTAGSITVGDAPDPANFEIVDVDPSGDFAVEPGADVETDVTVENTGAQEDTQDVVFNFEGDVADSASLTLDEGAEDTVTLSTEAPDTEGDYDWFISTDDDQSATWTLTVDEDPEPPGDASVVFPNQDSLGDTVFIDSAQADPDEDSQLAIWTLDAAEEPSEILGNMGLDAGESIEDTTVDVEGLNEDQTLVAAIHDVADIEDADGDNIVAQDSAAVNVVDRDADIDDPTDTPTQWQGQTLVFESEDFTLGDDYQVRNVDGTGEDRSVGNLEREIRSVSDNLLIVRTSSFASGLYILETDDARYELGEPLDDLDDEPGFGFEIAVQDPFSVDGVSPAVTTNETFVLGEIDSVRSGYNLAVTGIDEDGNAHTIDVLTDLGDFEENVPVQAADIDGNPLAPGNYTLLFNVTDTTASDSAEIDVLEELDEEVTIASPTPQDDSFARGDIVPIELEFQGTNVGTLTFGDRQEGQAVEVNVTVEDVDGSGSATVLLNTFQFGTEHRDHGFLVADESDAAIDVHTDDAIVDLDGGGADGGAVLASASYDLVSTAGEEPWHEALEDDRSIARLDERGTQNFTVWTAPGIADDELEPVFVEDIREAVDDGLVTPSDGTIADRDFLLLDVESTGLEGVLHEAALLEAEYDEDDGTYNFGAADPIEAAAPILDRTSDHDVGDVFFATDHVRNNNFGSGLGPQEDLLALSTDERNPGPNLRPYTVDFEDRGEGVFAGVDESGNLNQYYIPIQLDSDDEDIVFDPTGESFDRGLTPGDGLESTWTVNPVSPNRFDYPSNLPFVGFDPATGASTETEGFSWEFRADSATIDMVGEVLAVPQSDDVEISGVTNVAAGANLTVRMASASGEEDPFFKIQSDDVDYVPDAPNTWSIEEDFSDTSEGTNFNVRITRAGDGQLLTDGEAVPGVVSAAPVVNEFVFEDQESTGTSVFVETFNSTQGGFIGIYDADGDRIGTSPALEPGEQNRISVSLDENLDANQEVTATAYRAEDRPYTEADEPVQRTAMISVEDPPEPASFSLSGLDPQTAELDEPGPAVDVTATITNDGEESGIETAELRIDGDTIDFQEVELDGGESADLSFTAETEDLEPGTYTHSVWIDGDELTGTLVIDEVETPTPDEPTPTPDEPTPTPDVDDTDDADDDGAGFGVIVALLAFLGAALLAVRRQVQLDG